MKAITLYLGLDVHKDSITIAIAQPGSKGEIRLFGGTLSPILPDSAAAEHSTSWETGR